MDAAELIGAIVGGIVAGGGGTAAWARWGPGRRREDGAGDSRISKADAETAAARREAEARREERLLAAVDQLTRDVGTLTGVIDRLRAKVHEHSSAIMAHGLRLDALEREPTGPYSVVPERGR